MIFNLIQSGDTQAIERELRTSPQLANAPVPIDGQGSATAHPLHRICDAVSSGEITDEKAVEIAKIFLAHGAAIDGFGFEEKKDTPLIAAASLGAEKVGILYIERGAELSHGGCRGGTALHWAAWMGLDDLVKKLIEAGAPVNKNCSDYQMSPLGWALHGRMSSGDKVSENRRHCVRMLLDAGAETAEYSGTNLKFLSREDHADRAFIAMIENP